MSVFISVFLTYYNGPLYVCTSIFASNEPNLLKYMAENRTVFPSFCGCHYNISCSTIDGP